jgi:hypothetical protein
VKRESKKWRKSLKKCDDHVILTTTSTIYETKRDIADGAELIAATHAKD